MGLFRSIISDAKPRKKNTAGFEAPINSKAGNSSKQNLLNDRNNASPTNVNSTLEKQSAELKMSNHEADHRVSNVDRSGPEREGRDSSRSESQKISDVNKSNSHSSKLSSHPKNPLSEALKFANSSQHGSEYFSKTVLSNRSINNKKESSKNSTQQVSLSSTRNGEKSRHNTSSKNSRADDSIEVGSNKNQTSAHSKSEHLQEKIQAKKYPNRVEHQSSHQSIKKKSSDIEIEKSTRPVADSPAQIMRQGDSQHVPKQLNINDKNKNSAQEEEGSAVNQKASFKADPLNRDHQNSAREETAHTSFNQRAQTEMLDSKPLEAQQKTTAEAENFVDRNFSQEGDSEAINTAHDQKNELKRERIDTAPVNENIDHGFFQTDPLGGPHYVQQQQNLMAAQKPAGPDVSIGQIDVFIENTSDKKTSRNSARAKPGIGFASRYMLGRL